MTSARQELRKAYCWGFMTRKVLEMDPTEIRRLYIKGWFFIDLIATFPFDVFFDLILLGSTEVRSAQERIEWC